MQEGPAGTEDDPAPCLPALRVWADAEPRAAALNMALDEVLLRRAGEPPASAGPFVPSPVLRFYAWARPAVSFGYFDRWEAVRARFPRAEEWVRRWTGGGAVDHTMDLTFSLALPAGEPLAAQPSSVIYRAVHAALASALRGAGVSDARLADAADADPTRAGDPAPCFIAPVRADVISAGRKIAGGAQRRTRAGVLHQGSVQGLDRAALGGDFHSVFARRLAAHRAPWTPPDAWMDEARALAADRYATAEWNQRR